jgi:hypothetical protein
MFREKNPYPDDFFSLRRRFHPDNGTHIGLGPILSGQMEVTYEKSAFSSKIPIFWLLQRSGAIVEGV